MPSRSVEPTGRRWPGRELKCTGSTLGLRKSGISRAGQGFPRVNHEFPVNEACAFYYELLRLRASWSSFDLSMS